eukprot:CAMPEP_0115018210 /NCGR_PEP_ID=MMETSP0216-20121206/28643_1 /TAXON_ID=223996 /ORGANISM="Protocruzia adherens, Strain Boccale" /LENGTH=279 /DNA_ID=CAMNT_0002389307 /DNA_START=42 /DNA_END=881 /DNA_ORIENTATION=+
MAEETSQRTILKNKILQQYSCILEYEEWGQVAEETDILEELISFITDAVEFITLEPPEKKFLNSFMAVLKQKLDQYKYGKSSNIMKEHLTEIKPYLQMLFDEEGLEFPHITEKGVMSANQLKNSSQYANLLRPKGTQIYLDVERIGLKDAGNYIHPMLTISVVDQFGKPISMQDTPYAERQLDQYIFFNTEVNLEITYEEILEQQLYLFFEFKHYKPKKKKVSTRCWAFMDTEELKDNTEAILELYKKPTDFRRKRVKLHSIKPLYLHMMLRFRTPSSK